MLSPDLNMDIEAPKLVGRVLPERPMVPSGGKKLPPIMPMTNHPSSISKDGI